VSSTAEDQDDLAVAEQVTGLTAEVRLLRDEVTELAGLVEALLRSRRAAA
jgi:hypothetical protein